ncbi:MAG: hypothetical protein HY809_07270 [Nitrospirae bacterium]|nr:hypothetical protein [Nitrospirota bacterium]
MRWTDKLTDELTKKRSQIDSQRHATKAASDKFKSLSPSVVRILKELGKTLWGGGFLSRLWIVQVDKKLHIWRLVSHRDYTDHGKCIMVIFHMTHYELSIGTWLNYRGDRRQFSCKDLSDQALKEGLIKLVSGLP